MTDTTQSLSDLEIWFPHIVKQLAILWGTKDLDPYIDELMLFSGIRIDRRTGEKTYHREGFPADILMDLEMLKMVHRRTVPIRYDYWFTATYGRYL